MDAAKLDHIKALYGMSDDEWRFWGKVDTSGECWLWLSAKTPNGYGLFSWQGRLQPAHRLAYKLTYNVSIEGDVHVLHICDNPSCVNPRHLMLGTHQDNVDDKVRKGRQRGGKRGLSPEDVRAIRERYSQGGVTQVELAREYGVTNNFMSALISGSKWKNIKESQVLYEY